MKKVTSICVLGFLFSILPFNSHALESNPVGLGVDFDLPFVLAINGNGNHERANFNLGIDARHWFTDQMNYGLRFNFDLEKQSGWIRQLGIAPGFAHHWMSLENWRPFLRFDVPIVLKGAFNTKGSKTKKDIGISAGTGFVWKLGDAIGVENMEFRYDFDMYYLFGAGDAVSVIGLDLFRVGLEYRF